MIQVNVKCPYCKESLMDNVHTIDGKPSIKVSIQSGNKLGDLYLSSLYGSYEIISEIDFIEDEIYIFSCPHCNSVLTSKNLCEKCSASMVAFEFIGGSKILICSRRSCKKHLIEFEDLEKEISAFYSVYSLFFAPTSGKKEKKNEEA